MPDLPQALTAKKFTRIWRRFRTNAWQSEQSQGYGERPETDYLTTAILARRGDRTPCIGPAPESHPGPPSGVNMASFLPFLSELLPMVMPASTHVVRAQDIEPSHPTVEGPTVQRLAVVNRCGMCASVLTVRPQQRTSIRHNSEQDAILYVATGKGALLVKEGIEDDVQRHELSTGDFVFVPAWTEHQVCNEMDEDSVWLIFQHGARPVGAELADWGGAEMQTRS